VTTREEVADFDPMAEPIHNARALHDQVLARHPDRVNPGA
jgi:hypothetical protein